MCKVTYDSRNYWGVMHYGPKKSFDNKKAFEVYIFNFKKNIYGEEVEIIVYNKIRDIKKFDSINKLKKQIGKDIIKAKKIIYIHDKKTKEPNKS